MSSSVRGRPETIRSSLLRILFADREAAAASAQRVSEDGAWANALQLAQAWSVVPQLYGSVRELAVELPGEQTGELKKAMLTVFARSASFASKAAAALQHMQNAGIPALAFKGVASMARLYQPASNRTIKDADLLIETHDLSRAIESLVEIGFAPQTGLDPSKLSDLLENVPGSSGNKALALTQPSSVEIDLHWHVGIEGITTAALMKRSERLPLLGREVRVASAGDCLLLTARHSVRENFAVDTMCRDLLDVQKSCDLLASHGNFCKQLEHVSAHGGRVALLALTGILKKLNGGHPSVANAMRILEENASASEKNAAAQLRQLFFLQADGGAFEKDLLYLLHAAPAQQILRGAFTNWRDYRGFMRSMEQKLDGQELPLGQRVSQLAAALRGLRPSHLRSMRTLARLKYDH